MHQIPAGEVDVEVEKEPTELDGLLSVPDDGNRCSRAAAALLIGFPVEAI